MVGTIKIDVVAENIAEFGLFAVDPDMQSAGFGKKLLQYAQDYAKEKLRRTVGQVLVISVRDDIIAWYEREGFKRTGQFEEFPPPEANCGVSISGEELRLAVLRKNLD